MWRTSLSLYSKRLNSLSSKLNPYPNSPFFHFNGGLSSSSHLYSSVIPKPSHSIKLGLGFHRLSQLSIDSSSSLSRDLVAAVSHYGGCYWELSKARLRYFICAQLSLISLMFDHFFCVLQWIVSCFCSIVLVYLVMMQSIMMFFCFDLI